MSARREKMGPKKLAPLDHIKKLYDGAAANIKGENRRIVQKKDLVEAVREMNAALGSGKLAHTQSDTALALVTTEKNESTSPVGGKSKTASNEKDNAAEEKKKKKKRLQLPTVEGNREGAKFKSATDILQETLNFNSRKYNDLKVAVEEREHQLNVMIDELASLQVENESLKLMELHQTTETHRIDNLEMQIKEAIELLEQRQFRRSVLHHMKKRLETNQVAFDAHIKGMEEALNASSREFEEVKLLMRQLESGNSTAQDTLRSTMDKIAKERELRNKHLSVRRQEAANARRLEQWREQREKERMVLDAELRGDLSEQGEKDLIDAVTKSTKQDEELEKLHQRTTQTVSTYEEAFAAIREATGVRTLDEMVEKFLGQSANKQALIEEKLEAEQRQRKIKEDLARVQTEFSEFKAAGIGGSELNREMYDKLDNEILEARHELKIKQAVNARLEKVLIQVRAGMLGLLSRLQPFRQVLGFEDDSSSNKTGNEVLDLTLSCESKLVKLLDAVNTQQARDSSDGSVNGDFVAIPTATGNVPAFGVNEMSMSIKIKNSNYNAFEGSEQVSHVNNIRVKPRRLIGNGELGTPLSTARTNQEEEESEEEKDDSNDVLLLAEGAHHSGESGESDHDDDDDDDDENDDDDDSVYDAAALKKQARARVHRAMEDQKAEIRRHKTLSSLKEKRSSKQRVKRLAQPAKHRQKKGNGKVMERPDLQ